MPFGYAMCLTHLVPDTTTSYGSSLLGPWALTTLFLEPWCTWMPRGHNQWLCIKGATCGSSSHPGQQVLSGVECKLANKHHTRFYSLSSASVKGFSQVLIKSENHLRAQQVLDDCLGYKGKLCRRVVDHHAADCLNGCLCSLQAPKAMRKITCIGCCLGRLPGAFQAAGARFNSFLQQFPVESVAK